MAEAAGGVAKQFLRYGQAPLWWSSARALADSPGVDGLVLVFPRECLEQARQELAERDRARSLGVPWNVAAGGARRQDSVRLGLDALPRRCSLVLVHDSARPFLSPALVARVLRPLEADPPALEIAGVVPGLPVLDTIKETDGRGLIRRTPDRESLRAVQTPQAFRTAALRAAHRKALAEGWEVSDDATLLERCGQNVLLVEGERGNRKITLPEDLDLLEEKKVWLPCVGYGYDVHRYGGARPLILGGVPVPGNWTVDAHSDGDVLLHALIDALLGCAGGGDIGRLFPDSDPRWAGVESSLLLDQALEEALASGLRLTHADLTVVAQKPRLAPHAGAIRRNVARLLGLDENRVGFKATTEEGMGFTGEGKGLKAVAVVSGLRAAG
jgi:2-C-methyl-D-erythritol 4-phosphate cytidylyltransferase/2-C-methyl-D-erythritol 2,4-cyclodiphosphate synthase